MGIKDRISSGAKQAQQVIQSRAEQKAEHRASEMYDVTVNKGSINARAFAGSLNSRWEEGFVLDQVFEQDGNTVMIWKRRLQGAGEGIE